MDQRTAQLLAAKNEAESASAAKSEFLSRMSHELRTPLNAILGFAKLLEIDKQHVLAEEQADSVHEISQAGGHLLELINDVLDLSRAESGRLDLALEAISLAELVRDCVSLVEPAAAKHQVAVKQMHPVDGAVFADRLRLRQVLLNLLSNAIKYNLPGGTVTLDVSSVRDSRIRITVQDTGRGIAREMLPRLFQPFERLEASKEGIEGTGIGLAISMRLIQEMGGTIGVDSTPEVGTTFWVELPQASPPTERVAPASGHRPRGHAA